MKSPTEIIAATILCLSLLVASIPQSSASNPYFSGLKRWNYTFYQINSYNETAGLSYYTDTNQIFTVSANRNSHLLFEFQYVGGKGPSPYDPNNIQAYGNLYIGNLTRRNATMYEMASNLALSIYPWFPGFLTSVNWTRETQLAQTGANTIGGSLKVDNITLNSFGTTLQAIRFDFKQNKQGNYFQNTTLVYNRNTGALLRGNTVAGNYKLNVTALSTDIIAANTLVSLISMQLLASVSLVSLVLALKVRRPLRIRLMSR